MENQKEEKEFFSFFSSLLDDSDDPTEKLKEISSKNSSSSRTSSKAEKPEVPKSSSSFFSKSEVPKSSKPSGSSSSSSSSSAINKPIREKKEVDTDSYFEVHFLNVEQGDASLVLCDGEAMLIDGGVAGKSDLIYAYLKEHNITHLEYIIATHADADHVGGLSGALNYATVDTAYCSVTEYDTKTFNSFVKYLGKQGKSIEVPKAGDTFTLGSADVKVLASYTGSDDSNNNSIVLRVTYGKTVFLFTGDAEREEEQVILDAGYDLSSTVLKVGHHGSKNSTTYPFLREIMPKYAIISVGKDNSYGHPTDDTLSRLRDADVKVFRTDLQGHIICASDGTTVTVTVQKNTDADTLVAPGFTSSSPSKASSSASSKSSSPSSNASSKPSEDAPKMDYVLNTNTKKFHYPYCSSVGQMKDKNKAYYTGTRDEVIAMGYDPCGKCHP